MEKKLNEIPKLVNIQFESRYKKGTFGGNEYTYIADIPLAVGDVVKVPTKFGESTAKVSKIDVDIQSLSCRVGQLRHITDAVAESDLTRAFFG